VFWFGLQPARKAPRGHPSPHWGAEENGKKQAETVVGQDKGSLAEQQTKGTATTTIQIRRIHRTNRRTEPAEQNRSLEPERTAPLLCPPEPQESSRPPAPSPPEPNVTAHGYGIPSSVWPGWGWVSPAGCAPSWSPVKINPVLAKPRTLSTPYSIPSTSCPGPPLSS